MSSPVQVAVLGASGYSGIELLRILLRHPCVELVAVTSRSLAGRTLSAEFPRFRGVGVADRLAFSEPDVAALKASGASVAFLALPHGVSVEYAGALLEAGSAHPLLLASGTASIVGHASVHVGDVAEQCRESLRNLHALLDEGEKHGGVPFAFGQCRALRVYIRDPQHLQAVRTVFEASGLPPENIVYLHGEVCRRELAVELEGVFAA